ncbi:MAG: glycosyltransferase family 2 protein [Marmoricola sp.]
MTPDVDVLIPTYERPGALAVTLAGLAAQHHPGLRVTVSDQSDEPVDHDPVVASMSRVLEAHGVPVRFDHHLPRRGLAEQRDHLLRRAEAPWVLFLDDDVWLEPWAVGRLREAAEERACGFVGFAVQGLSYAADRRPHERTTYEEWHGRVRPERVRRTDPAWQRHRLHNAANPTHQAEELGLRPGEWRAYKVAWIGACVLYRRSALLDVGGFGFWTDVPEEHAGEDVVAQLRVMEEYGGAGILPSGAVHLELPTTVPVRDVECYDALGL